MSDKCDRCTKIPLSLHFSDGKYLLLTQCEHRRIHELATKLEREGILDSQYRTRIKRKYRLTVWNDKAMEWLAEQNEPVKVEFT